MISQIKHLLSKYYDSNGNLRSNDKYDEKGNLRQDYRHHTQPYNEMLRVLTPQERWIIRSELRLDNIEKPSDLINMSSSLVSRESLERMFEELGIDNIEVYLLETEGNSKKYVMFSNGDEIVKINDSAIPLCDYVSRVRKNSSSIFSSSMYKEIEKSQERKVKKILEYIPKDSRRILDSGCGNGCSTKVLARKFPEVVGVDISEEAIRQLKKEATYAGLDNISAYQESMENLHFRFGREFDASILVNSLEETLPWKALYSTKKVTKGPIIVVQDAFSYKQVENWSGCLGLSIKDSFTVKAPESEKGENEVFVLCQEPTLA